MRNVCLLLMAAVTVFAVSGWAQGKKSEDAGTRSVQGVVTAPDDTLVNGAVVHLKNTKTLQIRSFITQDQGTYYFHGLSPDVDYQLRADFQGSSSPTKSLSSFDTRKRAIINLKLNAKAKK